jgi:hypothetical protein
MLARAVWKAENDLHVKSITIVYHNSTPARKSPNCYTARLLALDTAALSFGGRLANSNLQAGVPERAFTCQCSFLNKTPTASCKRAKTFFGKKASNIWACGKENSLRTAKFIAFGIGEESPPLPCSQIPCPCSFSYLMCRHAALCSNTTSPGPRIEARRVHFDEPCRATSLELVRHSRVSRLQWSLPARSGGNATPASVIYNAD